MRLFSVIFKHRDDPVFHFQKETKQAYQQKTNVYASLQSISCFYRARNSNRCTTLRHGGSMVAILGERRILGMDLVKRDFYAQQDAIFWLFFTFNGIFTTLQTCLWLLKVLQNLQNAKYRAALLSIAEPASLRIAEHC